MGGKARDISDKVSQSYREHLGADLLKKQEELKALEIQLKSREKSISEREANLNRYYLIPRLYINIPIVIIVLAAIFFGYKAISPLIAVPHDSATKSQDIYKYQPPSYSEAIPSSSDQRLAEPPDKASSVQKVYRGLDMENEKFDIGRYCLNEEKKGVVTFEQCVGMAVIKAAIP